MPSMAAAITAKEWARTSSCRTVRSFTAKAGGLYIAYSGTGSDCRMVECLCGDVPGCRRNETNSIQSLYRAVTEPEYGQRISGVNMQKPVAYRRYAEECRALAENLDDAEYARLLDLAAQWEQLAR